MRKPFSKQPFSAAVLLAGRYTAVAIALLCVLGGPIHGLVVRHVYCALHGELTHANSGADVSEVARRPAAERGVRVSTNRAPLQSRDEHDHCSFTFQQRKSFTVPSPANFVIASAETDTPVLTRDAHPPRSSTPLLAFAPKNSPPIV